MTTRWLMSTIAASAFAVVIATPGFAQQDKDQQKCINAINKDAGKLAKQQGKENFGCVKAGSKGAVAATCPTDDLKGKVAKKEGKTLADEMKKCTASVPSFAYTSGANANAAHKTAELDLLADMFGGTDLSGVIVADKDTGKCQFAASKRTEKIAAAASKEFVKCKKAALKGATVSATDVQNCVGADPKNKVQKQAGKLDNDITKKCAAAAPVGSAFPGACSSETYGTLGACLTARAKCRMCEAANTADGLSADCDAIDDNMANASCGAPAPTECPIAAAGRYTITQTSGGQLQVASIDGGTPGGFPFPTGGTVIQDVSAASLPDCVHDTVVPFPGGFTAPIFCIPGLNFSVQVTQSGCGVGQIDSNGGSDYTVTEVGDTSNTGAPCTLPHAGCTNGSDASVRVDITVGNASADTCGGGGTANSIVVIPVSTQTWLATDFSCPDMDGVFNPGTDTDILLINQNLDFTTDTSTSSWSDIDSDGCSIAGAGPAGGFSRTGVCMNLGANTVTTVATGTIGSDGSPLFDLTFATRLPNTITGPAAFGAATCATPPVVNFTGSATRCIP